MRKLYIPGRFRLLVPAFLKSLFLLLFTSLLVPHTGQAQYSLTSGANTVSENFDGMGASATATLPANWKALNNTTARQVDAFSSALTTTTQAGGNSMSTTATNGIYNFGAGPAASATDRAVGGLSSSSASKSVNIYTSLTNNDVNAVNSFNISFDVEKYRNGSNTAGFAIQLYYSTDGTTWTSAGANFLKTFAADADNTGYASAPGSSVTVTNTLTPASPLAAGATLYLAWNYAVASGSTTSNAQALGIDNFSLTANYGVVTPSPSVSATPSSLSGFTSANGAASASQDITVSGSNLTTDITVTPPSPYEISTGSTYSSSPLTLTQSGGTVAATAIHVRIAAGAAAGTANGNLTVVSGTANQSVSLAGTVTVVATAANVVINQVYGGGGNTDAYYKNDFIELYNNESTPVNLSGWSVQYASSGGTSWTVTSLNGTIPAHGFYLVQEGAGANASAVALPTPDASGSIGLSATAGKIILCNTTTAQSGDAPSTSVVRDLVGFGSAASGFEGSGPAPAPSNTTSIMRITDGVDNNNNATDFATGDPTPRNTGYISTAPGIVTLSPPNGATGIPSSLVPTIVFDKPIVKGTGNITLYENGSGSPIAVGSPAIVISGGKTVTINTTLNPGKSYYILIDAGAFQDVYGNAFAGISSNATWAFSTYNSAVATTLPATFDFQNCTGNGLLPNGFTQYSTAGAQVWDCTVYGRDPSAPAGTAAFPNAVQINGYANGVNNLNTDWLISPKLDLTGTTYPLLSFWSRNAFDGDPLQLKISTDYTGSGDPALATWTDLNGKFPSKGSDVWTLSAGINLSSYKQSSVYIAFVYTSTTDDGSRWTLDDVSLINSLTPPDPSLTLSASNLEFGYTPVAGNTVKTLTLTANDLVGDVTLTTTGNFQVSYDNNTFGSNITIPQATANNVPLTLYVRFAPGTNNIQYSETLSVAISDSTGTVTLKGNSIDPASTLNMVNWNLNWFGTPDNTLGVADKSQQETNVAIVMKSIPADLFVLQEVVNQHALDSIVNTMPGYAYVINNYGSHSNIMESNPDPLTEVQKLAFVYKTAKFSNISTTPLLSRGINTTADLSNPYYNDWASGRFPFMMTADVTLSDNQGGFTTHTMHFINIHAKANTAPVLTAYARREAGAHDLDSIVQADYANDNVIIAGDFNDDLNQTITAGVTPPTTSYHQFTVQNASLYTFPTMPLSPAGQHSDVNYTSVIDNVITSKNAGKYYLPASATVLSDVSSLVSKYGTTTTDHYPVFTQYSFSTAAALPVKLLSFTAAKQGQLVKLSWATSQEINSAAFQVERSADGSSFVQIGTVAAAGYSNVKTSYGFDDKQPLAGMNYYRLRQVDLDGKADYSGVVKVSFSRQPGVRITPNPASSFVNITLDNSSEAVSVQIIDLNGRLMRQQVLAPGAQSASIPVSGLARGLYSVKVVGSTGMTTQKVLIQ